MSKDQVARATLQNYPVDEITFRPQGFAKWTPTVLFSLFVYFGLCFVATQYVETVFWDNRTQTITLVIGFLGIWRYGWWFTHTIRAAIYGTFVYPKMRKDGAALWQQGWRPRHLHFMMTTYKEERTITERVIRSICREVREAGVPGTIWLGSGDRYDEDLIEGLLRREMSELDITLRIIRQNQPGKRLAIGLVLRAMNRGGVQPDDLIIFMDGDFILDVGCVGRCLPLFALYPKLQAVTTDEEVLCIGPRWIAVWLTMRFAQRRIAMQSHALSGRVLTLTGRMSVFRARHLLQLEFIRLLEADHLEHWLWGTFRFLSGDDKSTWYYLLKGGHKMLYVPDALGYTVEIIEGSGLDRMVQNFRRWSGNMLRNGSRAIALGPGRMPFFIWWCLVDQRISMWTMLVSPVLAVSTAVLIDWRYLLGYTVFIAITRMLLSLFLFSYSRKIHLAYPIILYLNQLINASVKVYCFFRLATQRWSNRGNQKSDVDGGRLLKLFRDSMAVYLTTLYVTALFALVILLTGLMPAPGLPLIRSLFF